MQKTYLDIVSVCRDAEKRNEENLLRIIRDNRDTEYGKKYDFTQIHSIEEYRKKVPLADYDHFRTLIGRMADGEENVLTVYPAAGFCTTSGTTGEQKLIPVSQRALEQYSGYFEWYKNTLHREKGGKHLFLSGFRIGLHENRKKKNLISELYYQYLFRNGIFSLKDYAGGEDTLFDQRGTNLFYVKVWVGFCSEDITFLESVFLYDQLLFFQFMEYHWKEILDHIRAGFIPDEISLPQREKEYLCSLPVTEERLRMVEEECKKGFAGIAGRLWKSLELSSGISTSSFSVEDNMVRRYLGNVPMYYYFFAASECFMGVAMKPEDYHFVMLPQGGFFEYLPYSEDEEQEQTCLPGEVETGKLYEVVLTNFSGLYRYRIGDVVRITGFFGESPVVEFVFRKNQILNIAGEKVSVQQAECAIRNLKKEHHLSIREYCIAQLEGKIPAGYGAVFSVDKPEEGILLQTSEWLDREMKKVNVDYEDLRNLGFLGEPEVLFLNPDEYSRFLKENGFLKGHTKPRHMAVVFSKEMWKKWRQKE